MLKQLLLTTLLTTPLFAAEPLFTLTDPRGDDYGNGKLQYPMSADYARGDLDLVKFAARRTDGGTTFEATFARPVRRPDGRTVDAIGTSLDEMARLGFFTFNLDVYIDTDGQPDSGSTTSLPGRRVLVDPSTAWEKAISLTPQPELARDELKRIVIREERRAEQEEGKKGIVTEEERTQLTRGVDEYVFFPTRVRVLGNRVEFFVPDSFLGLEGAKPSWSYVVAVSGADVVQRLDKSNVIMRRGNTTEALMILPVGTGRPTDRFGGALENDNYLPPIIDAIVPAGSDQKTVLSSYDADADKPAVLKGVKP
ncbi:MAG TPA: glucodextranase DOMON-like domain-containing protein [Thermoanaerobaculia bacterium]